MSEKKAICVRLDESVLERLDELCKLANTTRALFIATCINAEYDNFQGNPQLKKIMEQMKLLQAQFDELKEN